MEITTSVEINGTPHTVQIKGSWQDVMAVAALIGVRAGEPGASAAPVVAPQAPPAAKPDPWEGWKVRPGPPNEHGYIKGIGTIMPDVPRPDITLGCQRQRLGGLRAREVANAMHEKGADAMLTPEERTILVWLFGLDGQKPVPVMDVARQYFDDAHTEQVARVRNTALYKLGLVVPGERFAEHAQAVMKRAERAKRKEEARRKVAERIRQTLDKDPSLRRMIG